MWIRACSFIWIHMGKCVIIHLFCPPLILCLLYLSKFITGTWWAFVEIFMCCWWQRWPITGHKKHVILNNSINIQQHTGNLRFIILSLYLYLNLNLALCFQNPSYKSKCNFFSVWKTFVSDLCAWHWQMYKIPSICKCLSLLTFDVLHIYM